MRALKTHCEGGPDHLVPMSILWGAMTRAHLMIEMSSGMGTRPNSEAMTRNR
uniref:Uncharacterized protein n=1 Tax=Arundo donax TaxID=35708 RepID=A0A0A9EA24_ARUDO